MIFTRYYINKRSKDVLDKKAVIVTDGIQLMFSLVHVDRPVS